MLGNRQQQTTESGAIALQAAGDIHLHNGISLSDVRELCTLFLKNNFPQLRADAQRAAEENMRSFATMLENRLANDIELIVLEKFREPDVQATINDAVQASARKGSGANPEILVTLILERVAKQTGYFADMVLSEAVQVVPKLTGPQIALLSFIHTMKSMVFRAGTDLAKLEDAGKSMLPFLSPSFGMSNTQKRHLTYAGVASTHYTFIESIFELQSEVYGFSGNSVARKLGITRSRIFKRKLKKSAPTYFHLLTQFDADNLSIINLTSVGQAIALANISNYAGKVDYTVWLK